MTPYGKIGYESETEEWSLKLSPRWILWMIIIPIVVYVLALAIQDGL